mmetsp:Transcript_39426/g.99213  ORF Transcript_39426/g.99213 Transcript_39426/m.99213 type:complete len:91 (-) Transcript_39426:101-373(-)
MSPCLFGVFLCDVFDSAGVAWLLSVPEFIFDERALRLDTAAACLPDVPELDGEILDSRNLSLQPSVLLLSLDTPELAIWFDTLATSPSPA